MEVRKFGGTTPTLGGQGGLVLGDVMLIHDLDQPKKQWWIGRVEEWLEGSDGTVRGASLHVWQEDRTA